MPIQQTDAQRQKALADAGVIPASLPAPVTPVASAPVDVSTLGSAQPFALPPAPTPASYDLSTLPSIDTLLNPPKTATENTQDQLGNQALADTAKLDTKAAAQTTAEDTAAKALGAPTGLSDFNTQLTDINSQINTLQKESAAASIKSEDRLAPTFAISGEQAQIEHQRSIKALGLTAIAQTLQGNIASAQATATRAVDLEFAPVQAELDYLKQALDLNKDKLTREDQKRADALQVQLSERQRILDQQKEDKNTIIAWASAAIKNNPGNVAAQTAAQKALQTNDLQTALNLVGQFQTDPIATQQAVANLALTRANTAKANADATGDSGAPANYNGDFAATISLASQQGGTNAQRAQLKTNLQSYIANKDYASAYAAIKNATASGLKGTAATTFQQQDNSLGVLSSLKTAMQKYADAGGDTNIFKGTADQVQTKMGTLLTDPKYASLAAQMTAAFQNYRLQMTGAAFGDKESAEYASILPSPGNTLDLNLAKLAGAQAYLNSSVESSITNVVGQGGVYIKQYAEGAQPQTSQVPADPGFTSWLKANGLLN